jgi:hypothetical protein
MKLLLLHLSDIHFDSVTNSIVGRAEALVAALREFTEPFDLGVVVVSGDIAFSGKPEQYAIAKDFFATIDCLLRAEFPSIAFKWVLTPGNHDCDLSSPDESVRSTVIDAFRTKPERTEDEAILQLCTKPQDGFFSFLESFAPPTTMHSRLLYEYVFQLGDANVLFRCYNTAWMSQNPERSGSLQYPLTAAVTTTEAALVISVLHHPLSNWLQPDNGRALKKIVERTSDWILTGHEHDASQYTKQASDGCTNAYSEGAVLHTATQPANSGFAVMVIDAAADTRTTASFSLDGDRYALNGELVESTLSSNSALRRDCFAISDTFGNWLDDPGVTLSHPAKDKLTLDDIFVWPDVREFSYSKNSRPVFSAATLATRIIDEKTLIIMGPERAGKTSLAKQLFIALQQDGFVPVLIQCHDHKVSADNLAKTIDRCVADQYSKSAVERFRQLEHSKRVLLVDDLDRVDVTRASKIAFLESLAALADRVVVFANDLTNQVQDVVYSRSATALRVAFHAYKIQDCGHLLRHAIVEKWLSIGSDRFRAAERMAEEWPHARRVIDTVVGKNFVPAYPVFVLSILQALESQRPLDTNASTYGYFYEMFIREALAGSPKAFDQETKTEYLARLAWWLFQRGASDIDETDLRGVHAAYEEDLHLKVSFVQLIQDLQRCRILDQDRDSYRFKYRYIYYYFVALYLRDRLSDPGIRETIERASAAVFVENNANIMLFLAHLSRDPFIIRTVLSEARKIYSEFEPAQLEADVDFVNQSSTDYELTYVDGDVTVSRRKLLSELDEVDRGREQTATDGEPPAAETSETEPVRRINIALKTIQILGQILKNFAGSIVGDVKTEIAEECYRLGLRSLAAIFHLMRGNEEAVVGAIFEILKREHPSTNTRALFERAKSGVYVLARIMAYGIIKRVAYALGSDRLSVTYSKVVERWRCNAVLLIDTSLKLDHMTELPESQIATQMKIFRRNPLAESLLRQLVLDHLYLFDVNYVVKQRLCQKVKIPIVTVQAADRRQKLIVSPKLVPQKLITGGSAR